MKDGEVVEAGRVADVFAAPSHPYTRMLLAAVPQGRPGAAAKSCQASAAGASDVKVHFPIRRGVLRRTVGYVRAVDGVSSRCMRAKPSGWSAKSGSGKTTMALAALRLERATGRIDFDGTDIAAFDTERHCAACVRRMQIVFQDPFGSLSPAYAGGRNRRRGAARARARPQPRRTRLSRRRGTGGGRTAAGYRAIAIRTSSAAASGSASPSRARWC